MSGWEKGALRCVVSKNAFFSYKTRWFHWVDGCRPWLSHEDTEDLLAVMLELFQETKSFTQSFAQHLLKIKK